MSRAATAWRRTALLMVLTALPVWAVPGDALPGADVDSLLELARSQNPEFSAMRHEAQAAAERVYPAGALPDPTLRTELQNVTNDGTDASPNLLPGRIGSTKYTVIQPLPIWGKRDLQRAAASAAADQAQGRASATWADLASRIKTIYVQNYQASRDIALTREILDLAGDLERIARARYANGLVPQQDVLRAQMEQTALRGELIGLEAERHHLHVRLNTLLRRPVGAPLAEPARLRPLPTMARLDYGALEQRVVANNPQMYVEQASISAAEKSRELVEKNRYPTFLLGISPLQVRDRISQWGLMLEMNIPLQQESRRAQEREALELLDAARLRRESTQDQLLSELAEKLASLDAARRLEQLAEDSLLPQSKLSFKGALTGYENGTLDFATLLDAQRQIRKARLDKLKAQTEMQLRLADIERLLGEDL